MLNKTYRKNVELTVPEIDATFIITGGGTVYFKNSRGEQQKAAFIKYGPGLLISHKDKEIQITGWDDAKKTFTYEILGGEDGDRG